MKTPPNIPLGKQLTSNGGSDYYFVFSSNIEHWRKSYTRIRNEKGNKKVKEKREAKGTWK